MTHTCTEFCSWRVTPELLNEHGFATEVVLIEKCVGSTVRIVKHAGGGFRAMLTKACLTAGSPFHFCSRVVRAPATKLVMDAEVLEWAKTHTKPRP